jgi:hypothetical protein
MQPRSKADEYRRTAANCLADAEQIADPAAKAKLIALAETWLALAGQADRNSKTDLVYETPPQAEPQQPTATQQQQQIQPDKEKD